MNIPIRVARRLSTLYVQRAAFGSKLPPEAVFTMDNNTVVCWHPEKEFPYEHSLPLPEERRTTLNSILCVGDAEIAEMFRKKKDEVVVDELSKMTYTTKHRWYPRARDKKAKKTAPDRPYL